jgi:ABC-type glutathione transport system ATPase component
MAWLSGGIPALGMTSKFVDARRVPLGSLNIPLPRLRHRQKPGRFTGMSRAMSRSVGEFISVTGVPDPSALATLGGVVAEMPSPLDANADTAVGELADSPTLALVGLAGRRAARCHELSGVERWRLALARAVATRRAPVIVDCSSRTPVPRRGLGMLLLGLRDAGVTLVVVTDDDELAGCADRIVTANGGRLVPAGPSGAATLDRTRVIHELLRGMT